MTRFEAPRVAIVGTGEIGRGWAALAVAAGWPVIIYDSDSDSLATAADAITDRVVNLVRLRRAEPTVAEDALNLMRVGRSLLQAVNEADWIIEAASEDSALKQKLLRQIEEVCRRAAILTTSSQGMSPSALAGRLVRPDRFLLARPLRPVELVPLVEVVPGPATDPACVEDVRFWLGLLGRAAIVFKKEVPGNFVGRIEAAVWRECIHLVLDGVLDVEDVDRAMAVGPALLWAAAGPHLDRHLDSGSSGIAVQLPRVLSASEEIWKVLAEWTHLNTDDQHRLIKLLEKAYGRFLPELKEARDKRLARLLEAMRE
jgi:3-hydroxybutyryl-CoA dehydrogenase